MVQQRKYSADLAIIMQPRPWARAREPAGAPAGSLGARECTEITTISYKNGDCKEAPRRAKFEDSARTDSASPQQEVSRMSAKGDHLRRHDDRWFCLHTMQWLLVSYPPFQPRIQTHASTGIALPSWKTVLFQNFKFPNIFSAVLPRFVVEMQLQIWLVKINYAAWFLLHGCEFGYAV